MDLALRRATFTETIQFMEQSPGEIAVEPVGAVKEGGTITPQRCVGAVYSNGSTREQGMDLSAKVFVQN